MPWFINHYECDDCGNRWEDEWSAMCDDQCPSCGARDISPYDSIDKPLHIDDANGRFEVYQMLVDDEGVARYEMIADFDTRKEAEEFAALGPVEFNPAGPIGFGE